MKPGAGERDDDTFSAFVAARQTSLLRTAWMLTGEWSSAEDLVQLALVKTLPHWERISADGTPDAYVQKVLVNSYLSWWRRARHIREEPIRESLDSGFEESAYIGVELRDSLYQLLSALPKRQRAVVVLRYYSGLSEAQTAQILGCSVGTIKSQGAKGLNALRVAVTQQEVRTEEQ